MSQQMPPAKQSHLLRNILIGVVIAVFACVICLVVTGGAFLNVFKGVIDATTALTDTSTSFMTALKTSDYNTAFSLVSPEQKETFGGSAEGMQPIIDSLGLDKVASWTFSSFNITNDQGQVGGTATTAAGTSTPITLVLKNTDGKWLISGVNLK